MLFRQNLFKSSYVLVNSDEVRVIDSDSRLKQADPFGESGLVEEDPVSAYVPQSFDGEDDPMAALFGEMPEGAEMSDMSGDLAFGMEGEGEFGDLDGMDSLMEDQSAVVGHSIQPHAGEAAEEAKKIIEEAQRQAESIVQQALAQAETEVSMAFEQAKEQGYQEGIQSAQAEMEDTLSRRMQELEQKEMERRHKYDDMVSEMEPHIVKELTGIYEHLIGVELSQYKSVLSHLIAGTLHNTESSDHYLIHVSSQDYSYVSMQKSQIMEECGVKNATFEVVEDLTLSKNQCLIETDSGIFDCSLAVQMEELKRRLTLLSYHTSS